MSNSINKLDQTASGSKLYVSRCYNEDVDIKVKTPDHLPIISEDIVEAYAYALKEYTCGSINDECPQIEDSCFCGFINSLWNFTDPVMARSDFLAYIETTDMTDFQKDELYRNYVHNWCSEQTIEERIELRRQMRKSTEKERYDLCFKTQEMAREVTSLADSVIAIA